MPPLAVDGPETISDHDALQEHPVGVEDLEPIALHEQLVADDLQRPGSLPGQQRAGLLIAVDPR